MSLISIEKFIEEEKQYRNVFIGEHFRAIAKKYGIIAARAGWQTTRNVKIIPDVMNKDSIARTNDPNVPGLTNTNEFNVFDHFFTFKATIRRHYWATCPYANGHTKTEIREALLADNIHPVDIIVPSPYADVMIIFDPADIAAAYAT